MIPTQQLMDDHRKIEEMLDILEAAALEVESGHAVDQSHLAQMLDFLRQFADRYHHGREEQLLFPSMEEAGVPREGGPIGVMLMEHVLGRNFIAAMQAALDAWEEEGAPRRFVEQAQGYVSLLRGHIYKEDHVLFPMAQRVLSPTAQEALTERFAQVETELLRPEARQAYMCTLEQFSARYRRKAER